MSEEQIRAAREIAAQCWCDEETKHLEMNVDLAEAFAKRIVKLQAALSAKSVPVGYKLVPIEPTDNQWQSAFDIYGAQYHADQMQSQIICIKEIYKAMLAAAPQVPTDDERVRVLEKDAARYRWLRKTGGIYRNMNVMEEWNNDYDAPDSELDETIDQAIASMSSGEQGGQ